MAIKSLLPRIIFLGILDVFGLQLAGVLGQHISFLLAIGIGLFLLIANIVGLSERLFPWRWLMPAFAGMFMLIVYPIGYSIIVAFSNYGDQHALSKEQVISQLTTLPTERFSPADAPTYKVYLFRSDAEDSFRFWLVDSSGKSYLYIPGDQDMKEIAPTDTSFGERDANGIPNSIGDFNRLPAGGALRFANTLQNMEISAPPNTIRLTKLGIAEAQDAKQVQQRWAYDATADTLTNRENGKVYHPEAGFFVTGEGDTREDLTPGFRDFIGLGNILRVINDPNIREPFWRIFIWTLIFSGGSVATTLALGLGLALLLTSSDLPFRTLFRSILILPYAVPGWLLVSTWRGLLNPAYGPVNQLILNIFHVSPQWFTDPTLAKIGVLFVNMYLGFPYMMLISMGALQSVPADMYEAATIDGANGRQQFRFITLPLLLIALAPLLVASFSFNFNNFTVIELYNNGGPPMSAASVAGHTDILLSYTYRLAFAGNAGADYGFAAAIGIFIFMIVGPITYFNFRLTRRLEEVNN